MKIIKIESYPNGARPPIQAWSRIIPPIGYAIIPNDMDTSVFHEHNGFVNITIEDGVVTEMTANTEAWEEWKASLPTVEAKHEATTDDILNALLGVTE